MSEYQYYEFRAVDRPLGKAQLKRLRDLSTRAAISTTSFVNTYQWGDFKGDPDRLMEQMFDAFLYFANWGTRRFDLRLPNGLASLTRIKAYCAGPFVEVRVHGPSLILEFHAEEVYDEYLDGEEEDWMGSLLPLREGLLRGDYRCLYLAWLRCVQEEEVEDDQLEPPLPPGLAEDSESLSAFSSFFEIDHDLIGAAAAASAPAPSGPSRKGIAAWVESIPGGEKDALLCAAACGELPALGAELLRRFHADKLPAMGRKERPADRRTAARRRFKKCNSGCSRRPVEQFKCGNCAGFLGGRMIAKGVSEKFGGPGRVRTVDLLHAMEARSQLRHRPQRNDYFV